MLLFSTLKGVIFFSDFDIVIINKQDELVIVE